MTAWIIKTLELPNNGSMRIAIRLAYITVPFYFLYLVSMIELLRERV